MNNLPELRDIHLPSEDISIFPLAYGWWYILLGLVLSILLFYGIIWVRKTSARLYAKRLMEPLKDQGTLASAVKMSEILRRICVRQYPKAVALFGDDWIDFIKTKTKKNINNRTADLLKNAPFIPEDSNVYTKEDIFDLWQFCNHWIGDNL